MNSRRRIVLMVAAMLLFGPVSGEDDSVKEALSSGRLRYTEAVSTESEQHLEGDMQDKATLVSRNKERVPQGSSVTYMAAVVEYEPYSDWEKGGLHILLENARRFAEFAVEAKFKGADLIVFPEDGLSSLNFGSSPEDFDSLSQIVPDPKDQVIPCLQEDASDYQKALRFLSCAAATSKIYVVVNLVEKVPASLDLPTNDAVPSDTRPTTVIDEEPAVIDDEINQCYEQQCGGKQQRNQVKVRQKDITTNMSEEENENEVGSGQKTVTNETYYNTLIVFDRQGIVIARYRKKHTYLSPFLQPGLDPDETALFHTDFGVTFSLQICFDMMYKDPAVNNVIKYGVHDVILSTAWIDELPFLTAPQIGMGWSLGLGVNLLVANYRQPSTGALGSGLYRGFLPEQPLYYYNHTGGSRMLVGKVVSVVDEQRGAERDVDRVAGVDRRPLNPTELLGDKDIKGKDEKGPLSNVYSSAKDVITGTSSGITGKSIADIHTAASENSVLPFEVIDLSDLHVQEDNSGINGHDRSRTVCDDVIAPTKESRYIDAFFYHQDVSNFSHIVLKKGDSSVALDQSVCHSDNLCCSVVYTYDDTSSPDTTGQSEYTYMLIAYSGIDTKGQGVYDMYSQFCGVVYCMNENISSCTMIEQMAIDYDTTFRPLKLEGAFSTKFVYPSILLQDLTLYDLKRWRYEFHEPTNDENGIVKYSRVHLDGGHKPPLLSIGLFGRWFDRDP